MRKKILWLAPAILVGGLVVLLVLAPRWLGSAQMAQEVSARLGRATGRTVQLESLRLRLFPGAALVLGPGRVGPSPQESGVGEAAWRKGTLDLALWPLLRRRLEGGAVTLEGLRLAGRSGTRSYAIANATLKLTGLDLRLDGTSDPLAPGVRIPWTLAADSLRWDRYLFTGVTGAGWADADSVVAERLEGVLAGGRVGAAGAVALGARDRFPVRYALEVADVPAPALLAGVTGELAGRWEGTLSGHARGVFTVVGGALDPASLTARGELKGRNGVIHAADWLGDAARYLGQRQDLRDIRYTDITGPLDIREGVVPVELTITGPDTQWRATGAVGLDGRLDVKVRLRLPPGFMPDVGGMAFLLGALQDEQNRLNLVLQLDGTLSGPRVTLDLGATLQGAGNTGSGNPQKGLGGLLDKWKVR